MELYQREGIWYFTVYIERKRYQRSTGVAVGESEREKDKSEKAAQRVADKQVEDIERGRDRHRNMMLSELAEMYFRLKKKAESSLLRDRQIAKHLKAAFGGRKLADINRLTVEEYRTWRMDEVSNATVNRETALLKHMFNLAAEWDLYSGKNPVKGLKKLPEGFHRNAITEEQEAELLANLPQHLQELLTFSIDTGFRHGDVLSLQWSEIEGDVVRKVTRKGKRLVIMPLTERALRIVEKQRLAREVAAVKSPFVFVNPETNEPWCDLWLGFKKVCRRLGMEQVTWHSARHSFCTRAARRGDPFTVQKLAGHSDIRVTNDYVDIGMDQLRRTAGAKIGDSAQTAQAGQ